MPRLPDLTARLRLDTRDLDRARGEVGGFARSTGSSLSTLDRSFSNIERSFNRVGDGLADFGKRATVGVTLPIAVGFGLATKAASDLAEEQNKANVVFGRSAAIVNDFASGSAKALGLSERAALEAAGTFGNLFVSLGVTAEEASAMSLRMVELGADLASFNNLEVGDVLNRLRSGLLGEQEAMERLGVTISETILKQKAFDLGLVTNTKSVLPAAVKTQAAYAVILEQSGTAQGDFARTSEGLANQTRILRAEFEDAAAELGSNLIPIALKMVDTANGLLDVFGSMPEAAQNLSLIGLAATAAVGPLSFLLGNVVKLRAAASATTAALAGQSLGAGAAAAAGFRMMGVLGKAGLVAGGLFAITKGLQAIGGEAGKSEINVRKLVDATKEALAGEFTRLLAFDTGTASDAFNKVLEISISEAQRVVDALNDAGVATGDWQERVDSATRSDAKAAVAKEKDAAAAERVAAALRTGTTAVGANTTGTKANTDAVGDNAGAQGEATDAATEYKKALDGLIEVGTASAEAELASERATSGFADALADLAEAEGELSGARSSRVDAARDAISAERALNSVEDARSSVLDAERALADARAGRGSRARELADAEKELHRAEQDVGGARGMKALTEAQERLADAQERVGRAREDGGQSRDVAEATEALSRAQLDARDAELALAEAREEHATRQKEAAAEVEEARRTAVEAALASAAAARTVAEDEARIKGVPLSVTEGARVYRERLAELAAPLAPGSELRGRIEATIGDLDRLILPRELKLDVEQALGGLARFQAQVKLISGDVDLVLGQATGRIPTLTTPSLTGVSTIKTGAAQAVASAGGVQNNTYNITGVREDEVVRLAQVQAARDSARAR